MYVSILILLMVLSKSLLKLIPLQRYYLFQNVTSMLKYLYETILDESLRHIFLRKHTTDSSYNS